MNFDPIALIQSLLIPAVGWVVALANRVAGLVHRLEERVGKLEGRQAGDEVWKDRESKRLDEHITSANERFRDLHDDLRARDRRDRDEK